MLYSPTDPASARLRGEGQDSGPVVSVGFGVAALLLVLAVARSRRARRRADGPGAARGSTPRSRVVAD